MLLRPTAQTPAGRVRAGLASLFLGIAFERLGPRLPGLADSAFWNGLVHGVSVVCMALGIFLSAAAGARRH